jgi:hypothetical protein
MDSRMEPLFRDYPQTVFEKEVRDWLKLNRQTFSRGDRTALEVAALAISLGFDVIAVRAVLGHTGAITGSRFENRMAMESYRMDAARAEIAELRAKMDKDLGLRPQWKTLTEHQLEGVDFKEGS